MAVSRYGGCTDYVKALNVFKEGYQFLSQPISITGDTTVDLQLTRR